MIFAEKIVNDHSLLLVKTKNKKKPFHFTHSKKTSTNNMRKLSVCSIHLAVF